MQAIRRAAAEGEARRLQQATHDIATLKEQIAAAEANGVGKDAWMREQVGQLRTAYQEDVHRLAATVEELRTEAMQANVYARASTRYLREQNTLLKHRLGHNALLAEQRRRRQVAWVGWKLVVRQGKALAEGGAVQQTALGEREGMIGQLEARLTEARATHVRQLRSVQTAHEGELEAKHAELEAAHEAIARLKTFSAHKLRELSEQVRDLPPISHRSPLDLPSNPLDAPRSPLISSLCSPPISSQSPPDPTTSSRGSSSARTRRYTRKHVSSRASSRASSKASSKRTGSSKRRTSEAQQDARPRTTRSRAAALARAGAWKTSSKVAARMAAAAARACAWLGPS